MKKREKYDKEFKEMAVSLLSTGKKAKEVADDLGIKAYLVSRWRRESIKYGSGSFSGNGRANMTEHEREMAKLKKELREVQLERDILKKAVGIFSRSDSKSMNS